MFKENTKYTILTPEGFKPFAGVQKLKREESILITLENGKTLQCSFNHPLVVGEDFKTAEELTCVDKILTKEGEFQILSLEYKEGEIELYDPIEVESKNHLYYSNDLISHNCEFLGTGDTYIDGEILEELMKNVELTFDRKYNNRMRIWAEPDPRIDYIIGVDVGLGRNSDYSAFHVINGFTGEQVAEFYSNKTPINEFAKIINEEAQYYNLALTVVERNSIGQALIEHLYDILEYENMWSDENGEIGLMVTNKNRDDFLSKMEEFIRINRIRLKSKRTVDELATFIVNDAGKPEADKNCNDDLVTSLMAAVQGLHTLHKNAPAGMEPGLSDTRDALLPSQSYEHEFSTYNGMTKEDIKWLLSK